MAKKFKVVNVPLSARCTVVNTCLFFVDSFSLCNCELSIYYMIESQFFLIRIISCVRLGSFLFFESRPINCYT